MISNFHLKFGRGPGVLPEKINATPVSVFVGSNNSGKSKVLLEIAHYCRSGTRNAAAVILEDMTFGGLTAEKSLLSSYGIFMVPGGELESWLKTLGATGHDPSWLIDVFERMGEDPDPTSFIKPICDDVWKFMSHVKRWLVDPNRRGIPA